MPKKVIIAEDHQLIIAGYRLFLDNMEEIEVVGTTNDGYGAIELVKKHQPDLLLLDLMMPRMNGLKVLEYLQKEKIPLDVLVVSMINDISIYKQVIKFGAKGYLIKHAGQQEFEMAIRKVLNGKSYYSSEIFDLKPENEDERNISSGMMVGLTDREEEVLSLIASGFTNKEIGDKLFVSHKTVDTHRMNIMKKLNVHNVAGLVRYAISQGYFSENQF